MTDDELRQACSVLIEQIESICTMDSDQRRASLECIKTFAKQQQAVGWREAVSIVESEPELEGQMPLEVLVKLTSMTIENQQRAAVRATKKSIAARCEAQAKELEP